MAEVLAWRLPLARLMRRTVLKLFLTAFILVVTVQVAAAATITLAWDPPANDPNVAGYVIVYGTQTNNYPFKIDVGNQTSYAVPGLVDGVTYYFAVQAYYTPSSPGPKSNEVNGASAIGTWTLPPAGSTGAAVAPTASVVPMNIDGDAASDFLMYDPTSGMFKEFLNNGTSVYNVIDGGWAAGWQ